jgi:ABC-type transport system involved in cytochrome bd biosynthesis fused ATPase/permease subunit
MAKNTLRQKSEEPAEEAPKKKRSSKSARKFLKIMHVFGIFNRNQVVKMMPYILFVTVLILFYIGNSYYAERTIREINTVKNELKEKRAEFISTSSELMFRTKQSEVAKAIAPMDIRESTEPQKKITVPADGKKVK